MALLDDLKAASANLDPSYQPATSDLAPILGALIAYSEHGDKFLDAADQGAQKVSDLLSDVHAGHDAATTAKKDKDK